MVLLGVVEFGVVEVGLVFWVSLVWFAKVGVSVWSSWKLSLSERDLNDLLILVLLTDRVRQGCMAR